MQGCNISCDRLYTSIELARWLLERKITIDGTIKTNHKCVSDLKKVDGREINSTLIYWEKDKDTMRMTSYVVNTKSSGKRNVLVLATFNPVLGVTKDDRKNKPSITPLRLHHSKHTLPLHQRRYWHRRSKDGEILGQAKII